MSEQTTWLFRSDAGVSSYHPSLSPSLLSPLVPLCHTCSLPTPRTPPARTRRVHFDHRALLAAIALPHPPRPLCRPRPLRLPRPSRHTHRVHRTAPIASTAPTLARCVHHTPTAMSRTSQDTPSPRMTRASRHRNHRSRLNCCQSGRLGNFYP
jgi:hypothetical protein